MPINREENTSIIVKKIFIIKEPALYKYKFHEIKKFKEENNNKPIKLIN